MENDTRPLWTGKPVERRIRVEQLIAKLGGINAPVTVVDNRERKLDGVRRSFTGRVVGVATVTAAVQPDTLIINTTRGFVGVSLARLESITAAS